MLPKFPSDTHDKDSLVPSYRNRTCSARDNQRSLRIAYAAELNVLEGEYVRQLIDKTGTGRLRLRFEQIA